MIKFFVYTFAIIGLVALVGAIFFGAGHQIYVFALCMLLLAISWPDIKEDWVKKTPNHK